MCSFLTFVNDLGHRFTARAMEWPGEIDGRISCVPRGHSLPNYTTRYGFVGLQRDVFFDDGINEHGLQAGYNELDGSVYPQKTGTSYHIIDSVGVLLGNCRSVEEALAFIRGTGFHTEPIELLGPDYIPVLHVALSDRTGRSVVVEWLEDGIKVYENHVGVMTNDPPYEEQLALFAQYNPGKFNEENFQAFDRSCSGRFLHLASLNARQPSVPTDLQAVNRAWAMLNSVDIVPGMLYWRDISDDPQISSVSTVTDLENMSYYFRTYDNYDIRKIDLKQIDFAALTYKTESLFGRANYKEFEFSKDGETNKAASLVA